MVWEILNVIILHTFHLGLCMRIPSSFLKSFRVLASANSSVGRGPDCSSEGHRFEPGLVDIKTSLTQLVECQPHELKAMG